MSIFDDDSNQAFQQFVTLAKLMASLDDSQQTEDRQIKRLGARFDALYKNLGNITDTTGLNTLQSQYDTFISDAKAIDPSYGDYFTTLGTDIANRKEIFGAADSASTYADDLGTQVSSGTITWTSQEHKDVDDKFIEYKDMDLYDAMMSWNHNEKAHYLSEANNHLAVLQAAQKFNYFDKDIGLQIDNIKTRIGAIQGLQYLDEANISDFLTYDEFDEVEKAKHADPTLGLPSSEIAQNLYKQIQAGVSAGNPEIVKKAVTDLSTLSSGKHLKEEATWLAWDKMYKIAEKHTNAGTGIDYTDELLKSIEGSDKEDYFANLLNTQINTGNTITDLDWIARNRNASEARAMKYNEQYRLANGRYFETNPVYDPDGSKTMGKSTLGISEQDLESAKLVFKKREVRNEDAITDKAWKYVLKNNGNMTEEEYKKYVDGTLILSSGRKIDTTVDNHKIAQAYVTQGLAPHNTHMNKKEFKKHYNHLLREKYPRDEWEWEGNVLTKKNTNEIVELGVSNFPLDVAGVKVKSTLFEFRNKKDEPLPANVEFVKASELNNPFFQDFAVNNPDAKVPVQMLRNLNETFNISAEDLFTEYDNWHTTYLEAIKDPDDVLEPIEFIEDFIDRARDGKIKGITPDNLKEIEKQYDADIASGKVSTDGIDWRWYLKAGGLTVAGGAAAYSTMTEDSMVRTITKMTKESAILLKNQFGLSAQQIETFLTSDHNKKYLESVAKVESEIKTMKDSGEAGSKKYHDKIKRLKKVRSGYIKYWSKKLDVPAQKIIDMLQAKSMWNPYKIKSYWGVKFPKEFKKFFSSKPGGFLKATKVLGTFQIGRVITEAMGYEGEFEKTAGGVTTVAAVSQLEKFANSKTGNKVFNKLINKRLTKTGGLNFPPITVTEQNKLGKILEKIPTGKGKTKAIITFLAGLGLGAKELWDWYKGN